MSNSTTVTEPVREARARRLARHQGLALTKSRSRTPEHPDFGVFWLADVSTNVLVSPEPGLYIEDVESFLTAGNC